jgi:hypothetical protein
MKSVSFLQEISAYKYSVEFARYGVGSLLRAESSAQERQGHVSAIAFYSTLTASPEHS